MTINCFHFTISIKYQYYAMNYNASKGVYSYLNMGLMLHSIELDVEAPCLYIYRQGT